MNCRSVDTNNGSGRSRSHFHTYYILNPYGEWDKGYLPFLFHFEGGEDAFVSDLGGGGGCVLFD